MISANVFVGAAVVLAAPEPDPRAAALAPAVEAPADAKAPTVVDPRAPEPVVDAVAPGPPPADTPVEAEGPPFYTDADSDVLLQRFGLEPTATQGSPRTARWRCLVADPVCGFNAEINATSAYAFRLRQGDITTPNAYRWSSGRAQYDLWLNFPVVTETVGRTRYNRMTLGPKGGVMASDGGDVWGNVGLATRIWLGRGKFAPTIEFTSALSFQFRSQDRDGNPVMYRSPAGFTADIGVGLGGFGALVVGGQYDTALAREEVPESLRVPTAGMFYLGFRGNIVWGAPAAAAVGTHAAVSRLVPDPR